jgi:hypothetical protein
MAVSVPSTSGSQGTALDLTYGQTWELSDGSNSEAKHNSAPWSFKNLTASGTTVVKTGAGQLHGFFVGAATGNITIYDNTAASGTKILDASALVAGNNLLECSFSTGLTIVLSGAGVVTALFL